MPDPVLTPDPAAPPATPAAAPAAPPAAPAAPPAAPPAPSDQIVFRSPEQLNERLDRAAKKRLKDLFGTDDEEELKKLLALRDKAEADRQAQLTREQQLAEERDRLARERDAATEQAEAARYQAHVTKICARLGLKNVDYAMFAVGQAADQIAEGEQLDAEAWLKTQAEGSEQMRAALGMDPPVVTQPAGATTTTAGTGDPPAPPAPGGTAAGAKTAFDLKGEEWSQRLSALGIG